jgi:hypothetical protein
MDPVVPRAESPREAHASGRPEVLLGLLAWAAQPLVRERLATAASADAAPQLEKALDAYQGEIEQAAMPARAEADSLLASLQRFALAWSGASLLRWRAAPFRPGWRCSSAARRICAPQGT